jgi:hypothetical protein
VSGSAEAAIVNEATVSRWCRVGLKALVQAKATFKAISERDIRCGQRVAGNEGCSRGHGFVESD